MHPAIHSQLQAIVPFAKITCYVFAILFGIGTGISTIFDAVNDKKEIAAFKAWLERLWGEIDRRRLHELPRLAVERSLSAFTRFLQWLPSILTSEMGIGLAVMCLAIMFVISFWTAPNSFALLIALGIAFAIAFIAYKKLKDWPRARMRRLRILAARIFAVWCGLTLVAFIYWAVRQRPEIGVYCLLFASIPTGYICYFLLGRVLEVTNTTRDVYDRLRRDAMGFGLSVTISATITALAMLIGARLSSDEFIPRNWQMIGSNVLFDSLTIMATYAIFHRASNRNPEPRKAKKDQEEKPRRPLPLVLAVIADLALAAALAVASLWLGLWHTSRELGVAAILRVMVGRSPSGKSWDFGSYFWTMHTTFLPLLCLLILLLFLMAAKTFLILPLKWLFGRGKKAESPFKVTQAFFAMLTGIFGGLAAILTVLWK